MEYHEIVIIGGGPAGLAAAVSAYDAGCRDVLVIERDERLGGILNQCIHNGFGLHTFKEELTGPEYAERYIRQAEERGIEYKLRTIVADVSPEREILYVSRDEGAVRIKAGAIVLAMGCRERPRGALGIPGYRPAGIYTAGTAQGLIMARRMTLEGAKVKVVAELMPYSGGLKRNIVQCLDDYGIPLKLSHTVTCIHGKERVEGVTVSEVGPDRRPVPGTEEFYSCDTLLLSCGLLPENELSKQAGITLSRVTGGPEVDDSLETSVEGVFACGNVLHVHDLVDFVSEEAERAGRNAAAYVRSGGKTRSAELPVAAENGVTYTVPQRISADTDAERITVRFRVNGVYRDKYVAVRSGGAEIKRVKRRVMAPGEMEELTLTGEDLRKCAGGITVGLED